MITYVDTSTLIKLIVDEDGSDRAELIYGAEFFAESSAVVLKSPDHIFRLAAIRKLLPAAHVVVVVRDQQEQLLSWISLVRDIRRSIGVEFTDDEVEHWRNFWVRGCSLADAADDVTRIEYRDLIASPVEVAREIAAAAGADFDPDRAWSASRKLSALQARRMTPEE